MAKPEPSGLIPRIVIEFAASKGMSVSAFSESLNHAHNWISGLFVTGQPNLQLYINLAKAGEKTLDELAGIILRRQGAQYVQGLIQKYKPEGVSNRAELARHIKVKETTLFNICQNNGKLNAIKPYFELAKVIGCDIEDLRLDRQAAKTQALETITA